MPFPPLPSNARSGDEQAAVQSLLFYQADLELAPQGCAAIL